LGVDCDSEIVAFDYDERDEGVKEMIRVAVEGSSRNQIHSGLCGPQVIQIWPNTSSSSESTL